MKEDIYNYMFDYTNIICECVLYEAGLVKSASTAISGSASRLGSSIKGASTFAGIMSGITLLANVLNNKLQYADKLSSCKDDVCEQEIKKEIRRLNTQSGKEAIRTFGTMAITSTLVGWMGMPAIVLMNVIPIFFNKHREEISDEQTNKYNERLERIEARNNSTLEKLKSKKIDDPDARRRNNEAIQIIQKDLSKIKSMKK